MTPFQKKNKRIYFSTDYVQKIPGDKKEKSKSNGGLLSIVNIAEKNNMIDLVDLLSNRITFECLSVFNSDGSMRKKSEK